MNPKIKSLLADLLGITGGGMAFFGLYQVSMPLAFVVGGIWLIVVAVLLEKR